MERLAARTPRNIKTDGLYLAFATILSLATRSTRPGTALRDVCRLGWGLGSVELGVHGCVAHVVLGKLWRALWTTVYAVSVDREAVCATALLGAMARARWLHERRGRGSIARVGR